MATAIESTRISRLRTAAPSGFRRTRGDGRPGVPSGTARPSITRPAAASSPTSAADGAAREAGGGDELGTGEGTTLMKAADDGAEVRSMNGFAALSDVDAADSQGL